MLFRSKTTPLPWQQPQAPPRTTIFNTYLRRHHPQSTSRNQPSNRESILVKVHFSMISTAIPKFVHNRGHGFSKRLNPAGVYCFYHRYRPAPRVYISPRPGRLAEWARLQPLACLNLTPGSLVKPKSNIGASNTAGPKPPLTLTVHVRSSSILHTHANGKLKLKDPGLHPRKLLGR